MPAKMRAAAKPTDTAVCPSCAAVRPVRQVGRAVIGGQQGRVLECQESSCGLQWCPPRPRFALPDTPSRKPPTAA